ncbi:hypothetical protein [Mycolicibacterium sphagni]|uniref:hypothetical protein n=1 Tax=Mycolicibacterium sphagni TaxID=1786 RepID=UPI0021F3BA5D|nr:hypothetical protein [Mycolicibacterium sphagni]MCV7174821.1 hypothetical protein [Mycolicibacterium sphagni]
MTIQVTVIQTGEGIFYDDGGELIPVPCQMFALCDNAATTTVPHPIIGDCPSCARCAAKMEALR